MKKALSMFLVSTFSLTAFSQTWIRPEDANKHQGNTVNLLGFVTNVTYVKDAKGYYTLIQLRGKDSTQVLRLVILNSEGSNAESETAFINQYVYVQGKVEIYKGNPQIVLHSEKQIAIAREAPEQIRFEPL